MTAERLHSRAPSRHSATGRDGDSQPQATGPFAERESALARASARESGTSSGALSGTSQAAAQQISGTQILIALLLAPLAWLAQVAIAEMVLGDACPAAGPVFVVHSIAWTPATVAVASVFCVLFGGVGAYVAWRNLRRTADIPWRFPSALRGTRAERDWFVARICAMSSTMFMLGLVGTDVAMLLIAPCSPW